MEMRKMCNMFNHKWSKWEDYHKFISTREAYINIVQKKQCSVCDKIKLRTESND